MGYAMGFVGMLGVIQGEITVVNKNYVNKNYIIINSTTNNINATSRGNLFIINFLCHIKKR